jgi:hypothetical protein
LAWRVPILVVVVVAIVIVVDSPLYDPVLLRITQPGAGATDSNSNFDSETAEPAHA